jgi:ABC-type amino acid transport substrate-binding protein
MNRGPSPVSRRAPACLRAALGLALLGFLFSIQAHANDFPAIQSSGTLRVLTISFSEVPAFYQVNKFDVELLDGFAGLHHLTLSEVHVPAYADLIPALLAGKGDVIAGGLTNTATRRKSIEFSAETFPSRMVVVTRKPHRVIRTPDELRAETHVGTEKGTSWAQATADAGVVAANVDDSILLQDLPEALKAGKIQAAIFELSSAIPAQAHDADLQLGMFVGTPGSQAYGVRKGDVELLRVLNEFVETVRHTTTWNRLVVKFFGANALDVLKRSRQ